MKGGINTALLVKAVLSKEEGIGTGRRLSNVSIFELPGVERLIFLTDPVINPELFPHEDASSGIDRRGHLRRRTAGPKRPHRLSLDRAARTSQSAELGRHRRRPWLDAGA